MKKENKVEHILSDPILISNCKVEFIKGSGPGGQHRNKTESGVRLTHLPSGIVVTATERRHQGQNRRMALKRLKTKLEALYAVQEPRIATAKAHTVRAEEIASKRRHGALKKLRKQTPADE